MIVLIWRKHYNKLKRDKEWVQAKKKPAMEVVEAEDMKEIDDGWDVEEVE